ncbi:DUF4352 domain-containing protein [Streptomyces sp. Isolate_45]|uniref:DUF4352 domain-containing protein n=1 Tax=Streptomyces sp. Isolate_45 TaxID=2950111 RepID=UPI002481F223|nr:DUF4352 domain-containing protein [Streptomyces sp. Isolate_45]MDA5281630.1 DUF4352 domain-containing protein [Streptomyces sp. Isolate_45]
MRRVLALVLSGLLASAAVACSGEATVTTAATGGLPALGAATPAVAAPRSVKPSPVASAAVGATLDIRGLTDGEGLAVTLVKVVDPARTGNPYSAPDAGSRLVAVQFRLKNTGTAVYQDSPSNGAKVVDEQGQQFGSAYQDTTAGPGFPGSITVAPGDTGLGFITFEVPKASRVTMVQFAMNSGFSPNTGQWRVP